MSAFVSTPLYPDVPIAVGVPIMARLPGPLGVVLDAVDLAPLLVDDEGDLGGLVLGPQWGVFDNSGALVLEPDSIFSLDVRKERRISSYPVEQGGFQSYDKVAVPAEARVQMIVEGPPSNITDFLTVLDAVVDDLNLYTVATPDYTYVGFNLVHYDFHREARNGGASMLMVDVSLEEVRETATSATGDTAQPTGADPTQGGQVQPAALPGSVSNAPNTLAPAGGSQGFGGVPGAPGTQAGPAVAPAAISGPLGLPTGGGAAGIPGAAGTPSGPAVIPPVAVGVT